MKKLLTAKSFFEDSSTWLDFCLVYGFAAIATLLNLRWYILVFFAFISGVVCILEIRKHLKMADSASLIRKKVYSAIKSAKKQGDSVVIYKTLENDILPEIRSLLPRKIYKYYALSEDRDKNIQKINTVKNNSIWSSVYSGFNDPFECQYMYLTENDFVEMGFPAQTKNLWDKVMEEIRQRITTVCFTQNPNNMPMWAHYANEHKGFCIEYQIDDSAQLYPVFYVDKRLKAQALFINLFYELFNENLKSPQKTDVLKHIMLMSAFKDKSWESENEIRAIFLNSKSDVLKRGRLCTCEEIGIHPTKIYIGAECCKKNETLLMSLSQDLNIEYEKCKLSTDDNFSVTKENINV